MAENKRPVSVPVDDGNKEEIDLGSLAKEDSEAMQHISGFKLGLTRNTIKLKNHIAIIPLLMIVASMILVNFCINVHAKAISSLSYSGVNAFLFFCDTFCAILASLLYLNSQSKKSSVLKKYLFLGGTFVCLGLQLFFEYRYLKDISIETGLLNSPIVLSEEISNSVRYTNVHIVMVYISMALAAIEPVLQPFCSKIKVHF